MTAEEIKEVFLKEDKATFVSMLQNALITAGAGRYDWLKEHPLVYINDGFDEYVYCEGLDYRKACVNHDSLPAMMADMHKAGIFG